MFCPQCGNSIMDDFNFCTYCGCKLKKNIEKSYINNISYEAEFKDFDGTVDSFRSIVNTLLYIDNDLDKIEKFFQYAKQKNNTEINSLIEFFNIYISILLSNDYRTQDDRLLINKKNLNYREYIKFICQEKGLDVAKYINKSICTWRYYEFEKLLTIYCIDFNRYEYLYECLYGNANGVYSEQDKAEMHKEYNYIKEAWNGEINISKLVNASIDSLNMEYFFIDMNNVIESQSAWIDETYENFLRNAIKFHKADYLQGLFPTKEQREKYRQIVQYKLRNNYTKITYYANLVNNNINECKKVQSQIDNLKESNSGTALMKKGALTVGLSVISGPLGIINAVREGYNYFERDSKLDSLYQQLSKIYGEKLSASVYDLQYESVEMHIKSCRETSYLAENILFKAIIGVVNKLQEHGVMLKPIEDYFKPYND